MEQTRTSHVPGERVAAVRRFNRFYTRQIGVLDEGHLQSPYSLGEVRVLYELAHWAAAGRGAPAAADVARELGLDAGYLSRLLRDFERRDFVERTPSPDDGRQSHLRLTAAGQAAFADLDARAHDDVAALLGALSDGEQRRLLGAMATVEAVLARTPGSDAALGGGHGGPPYLLRPPHAGDLGWVVARHGALYAAEYAWDERFEALVARIVADFVEHHEPKRERCWIAERDGENVGSVFLVRHRERPGVAKLRLLLVDPSARGLGIGGRLVDECTRFARHAGYHTITLWTNSVLTSARRIYEAAGYRLVEEAPHHSFGHDLVGQTWELTL
ncbi:MAG: GNAT family N-acetyltransferase [Gemmatimonadaceae bacterium]